MSRMSKNSTAMFDIGLVALLIALIAVLVNKQTFYPAVTPLCFSR